MSDQVAQADRPRVQRKSVRRGLRSMAIADRGRDLAERASRLGYSDVQQMLDAIVELGREIGTQGDPMSTTGSAGTPAQAAAPAAPAQAPATATAPATPAAVRAAASPAVSPPSQMSAAPPVAPAIQPPAAPATSEVPTDRAIPDHIRKRMQAQQVKAQQQYTTLQSQFTAEQTRAQQLEQQNTALREEMRIKLELSRSGVTDLDFAWFDLSNQLKEMAKDTSPEGKEKLAKFDPKAWAEEQRAKRPYIFGQLPVPATTGAPPATAPAAGAQPAPQTPPQPGPAQVAGAAAGAGTFNAMTASPKEFEAQMRARGIPYSGARPVRN